MGQKVSRRDFEWYTTDEPHATRRKQILEKHPEVRQLMRHDPSLAVWVVSLVSFQILSLFVVREMTFWQALFCSYFIGGVINHSLTLAIHEIAHNNAFGHGRPMANRILGYIANIPLVVPVSISFRKYHLLHHKYQGDEVMDLDLPTELEARFFTRTATKFIWLFLQPLFYMLRPLFLYPLPATALEIINFCVQLPVAALLWYYFGISGIAYLLGGMLMAMGVHPVAGHFVSEHYMFKKGYETYSYYGILNCVTFNVGYHNEHHDFPNIPGSRLHMLKKLAPEFYDNLPCHTSWVRVLYDFVMDPDIGPYARVKRRNKAIGNNSNVVKTNGEHHYLQKSFINGQQESPVENTT